MDEALNTSALLIESIDSDSDETDDEPQTTIGRHRKRWRHIPKEVQQNTDHKKTDTDPEGQVDRGSSAMGIPVLYRMLGLIS